MTSRPSSSADAPCRLRTGLAGGGQRGQIVSGRLRMCVCLERAIYTCKPPLQQPTDSTQHAACDDERQLILLEHGVQHLLELGRGQPAHALHESALQAQPRSGVCVHGMQGAAAHVAAQVPAYSVGHAAQLQPALDDAAEVVTARTLENAVPHVLRREDVVGYVRAEVLRDLMVGLVAREDRVGLVRLVSMP